MEEKQKFNWKRFLITISIILVTAGVVGGTTWYLMDRNANDIRTANDKQIQNLQKQINDLKKTQGGKTETSVKGAANIVLEATEDATIWNLSPNSNYGESISNNVWNHAGGSMYFYIKFQPINLPANATVNSVVVKLTRLNCGGVATPDKLTIGRIASNWSESTITWNTRKGYYPSTSATALCASPSWALDAKAIINAWRSGQPNYGFVVYAVGATDYMKDSYSFF